LEVYDRRIPIYRAIITYINAIMKDGSVDVSELRALVHATDEALFLFGNDVAAYVSTLYGKGVRLRRASRNMRPDSPVLPETRAQAAELEAELLSWFGEQYQATRDILFPYLHLG
jgi:hypothetical protein